MKIRTDESIYSDPDAGNSPPAAPKQNLFYSIL